jgi:CrcB protein
MYWVIGIAGVIGALLRYYAGIMFPASWFWGFPVGTLLVNLIGCFFLSWFTVWSTQVFPLPSWLQTGITTGLIGSFTTFSTFSVEVAKMIHSGLWWMALLYILLSFWGGFFFTWCGYLLAIRSKKKEPREVKLT